MSALTVIATIRTKPGKETDTEALLKDLLQPSHAEPGCIQYTLHRSMVDPRTFVFVERWASTADLEKHLSSPHVQKAMARKEELLEDIQITPFISLPGGTPSKETF